MITCPVCRSAYITNHENGQPDYPPVDLNDLSDFLYVALDNDLYEGPVSLLKCPNGHSFYLNPEDVDLTHIPTVNKP